MAHQRRIGASADRKPKSVDEQALAGAGLPGQDVEPRGELKRGDDVLCFEIRNVGENFIAARAGRQ